MTRCPSCDHENRDGARFCDSCGSQLGTGAAREERKVITALFCDLVGSTELGERLDHEDVHRLLGKYHDLCRDLITSHGGVVEKFIGDAVVGVFGVPTAHEDDPERAVRAALKIVDEIAASSLDIKVRTGVNTGEALVRLDVDPRSGEGFATGDTLNTAARLEAAAPVMGVAVGAGTYRATADAIVYEELEPVHAKGKAEPVPAWRALHPISRVGSDGRDRSPFVGRELELSMLTQLFERSKTRSAVEFVTIVAEPGLGKSRLVRELARYADALSDLVVWREGRCLPYGDGISFWALGEIVKAQAGILETDDQATLAAKIDRIVHGADEQDRLWLRDRLAPLVGLETSTVAPAPEEAFAAWRRFVESLAADAPAVVVIEDLHWADDAFVGFLEDLADRIAGLPLLIVVTARPEIEERHPSWPPSRHSTVLSLAPLTEDDVRELARATLPETTDDLLEIVLDRAGGSPLFAEQLAAMLSDTALPIAGGAIDASLIPPTVQALIAARIDALPAEPKQLLMEASVVGKTFWSGAVGALGRHDDLPRSFAELERREFVRHARLSTMGDEDEYDFWHALVRDVAYAQLTRAERGRMHASVARWIADRADGSLGEDAEIVVHHLDAARAFGASPDGDRELLRTALLDAGRATLRTDAGRAVGVLERTLREVPSDDPDRAAVSVGLGRALASLGRYREATDVLEPALREAFATADPDQAVEVAIELSLMVWQLGEEDRERAIMDNVHGRVGDAETRGGLQLLSRDALVAAADRHFVEARALVDRAVAMAESLDVPLPGRALEALGLVQLSDGDERGEATCRAAVDAFVSEGNLRAATGSLFNLAAFLSEIDPPRAAGVYDECSALAARTGVESDVITGRVGKVQLANGLGRFDEIVRESSELLPWAEAHDDAFLRTVLMCSLASVDLDRGTTYADPLEIADAARGIAAPNLLTVAADLASSRGDEQLAKSLLKEALAEPSSGAWLYDATDVAVRVGEEELVRDAVEGGPATTPVQRAGRAFALAMLHEADGEFEQARGEFEAAAEGFDRLGVRPGEGRALMGLGRCLMRLDRTDEALVCLQHARKVWAEMGADRQLADLDRLLETVR